jgi:hypothetical protein
MTMHTCPECQMLHEAIGTPPANAEVEIARIRADAEVRIAELAASADKKVATVQAEASVEVAREESDAVEAAMADTEADEHVTDAINAAAVGLDVGDAGPAPEPAPEPVVVQQVDEVHEDAPPVREESDESAPKKSRGLGMW